MSEKKTCKYFRIHFFHFMFRLMAICYLCEHEHVWVCVSVFFLYFFLALSLLAKPKVEWEIFLYFRRKPKLDIADVIRNEFRCKRMLGCSYLASFFVCFLALKKSKCSFCVCCGFVCWTTFFWISVIINSELFFYFSKILLRALKWMDERVSNHILRIKLFIFRLNSISLSLCPCVPVHLHNRSL